MKLKFQMYIKNVDFLIDVLDFAVVFLSSTFKSLWESFQTKSLLNQQELIY